MIIKTIIVFVIYGVLMFIGGRIYQWEADKAKAEEVHAARRRYWTYDREGRIEQ